MFGEDLEKFILENVDFGGTRANQDIYFNIPDKKFWIHKYYGIEDFMKDSGKDNILLYRIMYFKDWEDWNGCRSCYNYNTQQCSRQECMSEDLYEAIRDYDYVFDEIIPQIFDKIKPDITDFVDIRDKLSEEYDKTYEYVNKIFNSNLYEEIKDYIVEEVLDCGFRDEENDNSYLLEYVDDLKLEYVDKNDNLKELFKLLESCKVKEAKRYIETIL